MMFVKIYSEVTGTASYGKMISEGVDVSLVEIFTDPASGLKEIEIDNSNLQKYYVHDQESVFYPSTNGLAWAHCFSELNNNSSLQNVQLLETSFAFDVARYLLGHCYSSHSSYSDKLGFLNCVLSQRKAVVGIQGILSSTVNLEDHQLEVARKVLEDPLQRYILADEVGLGKTIEAGYIIKQIIFDFDFEANVLIICPESLKKQWITELIDKFSLGDYIGTPGLIQIINLSELTDNYASQKYDLLIIDEAHKVMPHSGNLVQTGPFQKIRKVSNRSRRLLLLSATPALHNEFGFLSMLSLVDPIAYQLNDFDNFKEKVSQRVSIASIITALTPENFYFLPATLDRVRDENLGDEVLLDLVNRLEDLTLEVSDQNDQVFLKSLNELRGYLSEAYKLNHRVIRNRRNNLNFITQNRGGSEARTYRDNSGETARFFEQFKDWTEEQITIESKADIKKISEIFLGLRNRLYNLNSKNWGAFDWLLSRQDYVIDQEAIKPIVEFIKSNKLFEQRCKSLIRFLRTNAVHQDKVLVFVTDINTADGIHTRLQNENIQCIRHNPDDDSWRIFNTSISSAVLVCDERAEEGLNIQGDKKKIFHFDLPLNANRIEQRIGRVDRYGEESPVICYASLCHDDKLELEWFKFLRSGLHIFKKSVASLQYLIDEKLNDVSFLVGLLEEGVTFLQNLKVEFGGEEGKTQRALDSLEAQDNLEELSDPPEQLFYGARDLDADYEKIERCLMPWLENHLEFSRINMEGKRFQLRYNDSANNTTKASGGKKTRIAHNNYHALLQRDGNVNGFTFDRNYCLKTRKNVPALLRYGNSLIDGLYKHASETPLGSVGGIWRFTPKLEGVDFPQIFLKNTYLVETDIDFIVDHLTDETVGDNPININMIERRCDGLFPPETITTWITYNDDLLPNQTIRAYLECEPDFQTSFDPAGFDIDINGSFNGIFAEIMLDKSIDWKFFCTELLVKGQEQVRNSLTNRFRENEISIITQMDRRLNRYKSILDNKSLNSEMMINNLIMRAISYPKISLISNLMVCITSDPELTRKMITDGANK